MEKKTEYLAYTSIFIALGVLLPLAFHLVRFGGPIFLPMHIPVLIAGLLVGPLSGLFVGLLSPLLSYLATGMPPLAPPILPLMVFELPTYGALAGLLCKITRENVWISLLGAMFCGRVVLGLALIAIVKPFFGFQVKPLPFIQGAIVTGLPGIVIQLILIPLIIRVWQRRR